MGPGAKQDGAPARVQGHRSQYGCAAFLVKRARFAKRGAPRARIAWSMGAWWHYFNGLWDAVDTIFDHWGNAGDLQASHGSGMGAPNEI